MKKSKAEIMLEALKLVLDYLTSHKIQGRILAVSIGLSIFNLSFAALIKVLGLVSGDIVTIIEALK